jgi:diaminopimelate dehydrogenase
MEAILKVKIVIVGLGKLGEGILEAASIAPDIEVVGAVEPESRLHLASKGVPIVRDIAELDAGPIDIVILSIPTKSVTEVAPRYHELGLSTVDCFDMHQEANWNHFRRMRESALKHHVRVLTSGGTDPGFSSMVRALFQIPAPRGITYTNYGPGTSMGHSVAVKSVPGVKDGIAITIPKGFGLTRRDVFVQVEEGADRQKIEKDILADEYFSHDETRVYFVNRVDLLYDNGHKVAIERKGVAGRTHNQHFRFETVFNNSAITGQLLVACARALNKRPPGIYTMIDMPLRDFLTPIWEEEDLFREVI